MSVLFVTFALASCAGPISISSDVAGTAIDKTGNLFKMGKVQSHVAVGIDEFVPVARQAAVDLDLKQIREEKHPDQLKLVYVDMRKQEITVTIVRRTLKATEVHIDVGVLGDAGMGELVLRQILLDLPGGRDTHATTESQP